MKGYIDGKDNGIQEQQKLMRIRWEQNPAKREALFREYVDGLVAEDVDLEKTGLTAQGKTGAALANALKAHEDARRAYHTASNGYLLAGYAIVDPSTKKRVPQAFMLLAELPSP